MEACCSTVSLLPYAIVDNVVKGSLTFSRSTNRTLNRKKKPGSVGKEARSPASHAYVRKEGEKGDACCVIAKRRNDASK
ncbi:MAG TPA: hypothetical protein VD816_02310 [Ohtaekwangia sp.]|nr:hypothetical protein [Ohtaekwangia sp.]